MPFSPLTSIKIALAAIGICAWAYGYRVDSAQARWIGIAFLAGAVVLRFIGKRPRADDER
jgi:hypothetical protein